MKLSLLDLLKDGGWVSLLASAQPLPGGVSSEVYLIIDQQQKFVVKRGLEKLRVAADWPADVSRWKNDCLFIRHVGKILPGSVPKIMFSDEKRGFFAMEFLDERFQNWKQVLLKGNAIQEKAIQAGKILGTIHSKFWGDNDIAEVFQTRDNFHQLRIDPYLNTSAKLAEPKLAAMLREEGERLYHTALSLVHGDFSPKNILVEEERMVVLDCETAWYGDPAFDVAFLMNHFALKSFHLPDKKNDFLQMIRHFWNAYSEAMGKRDDLELRVVRLLGMLMLARIDGKSPAEYLIEDERQQIKKAAQQQLLEEKPVTVAEWIENRG